MNVNSIKIGTSYISVVTSVKFKINGKQYSGFIREKSDDDSKELDVSLNFEYGTGENFTKEEMQEITDAICEKLQR